MESDAKLKKQSSLARLFEYAGNYKYLTILSWIFSVVSAWIALVPFYYIWRVIKEIMKMQGILQIMGGMQSVLQFYPCFFTFADCFVPICLRFMCRQGYVHS